MFLAWMGCGASDQLENPEYSSPRLARDDDVVEVGGARNDESVPADEIDGRPRQPQGRDRPTVSNTGERKRRQSVAPSDLHAEERHRSVVVGEKWSNVVSGHPRLCELNLSCQLPEG